MQASILIHTLAVAGRVRENVMIRETRRTHRPYVTLDDGLTLIAGAFEIVDLEASDLDGARRY